MNLYELAIAKKLAGGGGGDIDVDELSVTENGTYTASSGHAYSPVTVNVPNSYAASDEGKVVSNGALVGQTSVTKTANGTYDTTLNNEVVVNVPGPSGTVSITQNGTVDVTQYASADVNVSGGGGSDNFKDYLEGTSNGTLITPEGISKISAKALFGLVTTKLIIQEGPTVIEDQGCQNMTELTELELPSTLTEIKFNGLRNNSALTKITCKAATPPIIGTGALVGIPTSCAIYVPSSAVSDYQAASGWSSRSAYIQAIPE